MASLRERAFLDAIKELLRTGDFSDFTIICGGKEWKVHRNIICPYVLDPLLYSLSLTPSDLLICALIRRQSKYFATACKRNYIVGLLITLIQTLVTDSVQEGRIGVITLKDDDPVAVGRMLDYMYTREYEYSKLPEGSEWPRRVHLQGVLDILAVYILADKFDVPGLRGYCQSIFDMEAGSSFRWESDGMLLALTILPIFH